MIRCQEDWHQRALRKKGAQALGEAARVVCLDDPGAAPCSPPDLYSKAGHRDVRRLLYSKQ